MSTGQYPTVSSAPPGADVHLAGQQVFPEGSGSTTQALSDTEDEVYHQIVRHMYQTGYQSAAGASIIIFSPQVSNWQAVLQVPGHIYL